MCGIQRYQRLKERKAIIVPATFSSYNSLADRARELFKLSSPGP